MFKNFFNLTLYTNTSTKGPIVENFFRRIVIAICCQGTFDWIMWYFALVFAMHNSVLAAILATVIVLGVVQLDIAIVTADDKDVNVKRRWASLAWRFLFTFLVAGITSVPLELNWFQSEITHRLDAKQKKEIDQIRTSAMVQEKARIDKEIEDVTAQLAHEASSTQGAAVADLQKYEGDRAAILAQMVTKESDEEAAFLKRIDDKEKDAYEESAGKGASGQRGCKDSCRLKLGQAKQWREDLANKKIAHSQAVIDFNKETQDHLVSLRAKRDTTTGSSLKDMKEQLGGLRKERKDKVEELRKMDPERVADLYGGKFQKEFGFQDRYDTLEQMRLESSAVNWAIWACRVIAAIMGFLVLGMALSAPTEVKEYFSVAAQAEAGDPYAKKVMGIMGYENFKDAALTPKARKALVELFMVRQELWAVVMELEQQLVSVVVPDERTGLYLSKLRIEGMIHAMWVQKGADAMKKLGKAEEEVRRAGQKVPSWPTDKLGQDPRLTDPWKIDERRLASFGWESPEEIITAGKLGLKNITGHRLMLRQRLEEMEATLQEKISGNSTVSFEEIRRHQNQGYREKILPTLNDIRSSEDAVLKAHFEVPTWPDDFADPRGGLYQRLCLLSEDELRQRYDWKGIAMPGLTTPTATA